MEFEVYEGFFFTEVEQQLVERARKALSFINYQIVETSLGGGTIQETVDAVLRMPLQLDFKAHRPGEIGQSFLAPVEGYKLTEALFDGELFTENFLHQIEDNVNEYRAYLKRLLT